MGLVDRDRTAPAAPGRTREPAESPGAGPTIRAVVLALLLIPFNAYWIVMLDLIRGNGWPTVFSLVFTTVFLFVIVVAANAAIGLRWPRARLQRGELLTLYSMLATAAAISGQDMIPTLVCTMGRAFRFATPENGWATTVLPILPRWLTVHDPSALRKFYLGSSSLYDRGNLRPWLAPLGAWLGFLALLLVAFLCADVLLRRRWVDEERLTFPLTTLPLAITATGADSLFLKRAFWCGFAIAGAIDLVNGLHAMIPSVPEMLTRQLFDLGTFANAPPWRAIGWTPVSVFPFAIGIGFLMPVDLSFSCVFFYWVWKVERVARTAWGYDNPDPYSIQQASGVWIGLFVVMLWTGRRSYVAVLRRAIGRPGGADDSREPISYRAALAGLLLAACGLVGFMRAMGMALLVAGAFVAIYLALSTFVSRLRAELGPPVHDLYGAGPDYLLAGWAGSRNLGHSDLAAITLLYWINRESYRSHPMPPTLEGLRMASVARFRSRGLLLALFLAGMAGAVSTMGYCLHFGYRVGVAAGFHGTPNWLFSDEVYRRLHHWVASPEGPNAASIAATLIGLALGVLGTAARTRLLWFPFHIAAYTITYWWTMNHLWFGLLIAGSAKWLLFRYGGLRSYRRAIPFFLGVILGEFIVGGSWSLAGLILNVPLYSFQQP